MDENLADQVQLAFDGSCRAAGLGGDLSPVTPLGRIVVMLTFVSGLALFAGILGVLGSCFFNVMEEEIDPNIDPLEEFPKEQERQLVRWPDPKSKGLGNRPDHSVEFSIDLDGIVCHLGNSERGFERAIHPGVLLTV